MSSKETKDTRASREKSEMITAFTKILEEKLKPIEDKLNKLDIIENSVDYALEELKNLTDLQATVEQQDAKIKSLENQLKLCKAETRSVMDKLLNLENFSRKNNIKLWGIKLKEGQHLLDLVLMVLSEEQIALNSSDIERIHFVGPATSQSRPVLMRLHHYKNKLAIMDKRSSLKKRGIFVSEDYPKEILDRRKVIVPTFFKSLNVCPNQNPKLLVDSLLLGGKKYSVDNISAIPYPELQPKHVFTPAVNGITAFFSKESPLSNHFEVPVSFEGKQFISSEQCYMYQKAVYFSDNETAQKILQCKSPVQAKFFGKHIHNYDPKKWKAVQDECMFQAMYAKFSQNPELASFLRNTGTTDLVEANPTDRYWGAGIPLRDKNIFDKNKWKGQNKAGQVLSRVRQSIK